MNTTPITKTGFIGYSAGLHMSGHGITALVKAEFERNEDGSVTMSAVSARTLGRMPGTLTVNGLDWDERPTDPHDQAREAIWALGLLGYDLAGEHCETGNTDGWDAQ
ncbi:MAG TPA: hypothetical protein VIZ86_16640 [Pseudomonas sp.]